QFGDYLGIGAGAHGKITVPAEDGILRRWKLKHPNAYLQHAGSAGAIGGDDWISIEQRPFEFMLNALRLHDGFSPGTFEARTGLPISAVDAPLARAFAHGWLERTVGGDLRPTAEGRRLLNDVIELFLP